MIATVTLNPAVDKTIHTSRVVLGAVNRTEDVVNIAGGKGINVAKVLRQYGVDVKCLGFLGGYCGELIKESVEKMGAVNAFTSIEGETRTSINIISEDGYITEFLEPGPSISNEEIQSFVSNYERSIEDCEIVVISGSAPIGVESSIYADLITIANDKGKKVLLDASGDNLKKGMYARPYMIKPNLKELEGLIGRRIQGMQEVGVAASQLVEWGIPNVVVSMGSKGILYAKDTGEDCALYYVQAPSIRVVNSVGSGDSAVAAFAMSVLEGMTPEETVRKCVAISAANTMSIENGHIDVEAAQKIEEGLTVCNPSC